MYNKKGDFMKKIFPMLALFSIIILFSSCGKSPDIILDNSDNSRFIDFYTEDNYAYIECELNVYAEEDSKVKISATDFNDVENGLLKNEKLTGIDKSDNDETFDLKKGENKVTVLFRGDYAGIYMISEREIPRFIKIEKA